MGDFLICFGDAASRMEKSHLGEQRLRFVQDSEIFTEDRGTFSVVFSRVDGYELWGPYEGKTEQGDIWFGLAGRVSLSAEQWEQGRKIPGAGGLACKSIFAQYKAGGFSALAGLSGNFVLLVHHAKNNLLEVLTDPCGMNLCYALNQPSCQTVLCSHPDVLAEVAGEEQNLDMVSLAEFLRTGCLTFPHTYYSKISALQFGYVHRYRLKHDGPAMAEAGEPCHSFTAKIDPAVSEWELAEELAARLRDSVVRRTLPVLGRTGIGVSGGLDSRALLAGMEPSSELEAFFLLDEQNAEYKVAKSICASRGVRLNTLQRGFDYYGDNADLGVRISGGTGNLASNHYLGVRDRLAGLGVTNLVTGCYCDYMFKALAVNRTERKVRRDEQMGNFGFAFYRPFYSVAPSLELGVSDRLQARFPEADYATLSNEDWLRVETKRTFPLAYECDLTQRVIPQRVMPWSPPLVDNGLLDLHQRMPSGFKLNASIFKKAMSRLCPPDLMSIPDNNTGAPVTAEGLNLVIQKYWTAAKNRLASRIRPGIASRGSWPNWDYYVANSSVVQSSWKATNSTTKDVLNEVCGADPFLRSPSDFVGNQLEKFLRMWTLKLWLDQRQ